MDIMKLFKALDRYAELIDIKEAEAELKAMQTAGRKWTSKGKAEQHHAHLNYMFEKGSSVTYKAICNIIKRHLSKADLKRLERIK